MRLEEFAPPSSDKEQLDEWIPLAMMAAGGAWTAYDAWKMKKAYDKGEISGADMAKTIGTDAAFTIAGGAVVKVAGKGWKYGSKLYKSRKAAKQAELDAVKDAANKVRKEPTFNTSDAPPQRPQPDNPLTAGGSTPTRGNQWVRKGEPKLGYVRPNNRPGRQLPPELPNIGDMPDIRLPKPAGW